MTRVVLERGRRGGQDEADWRRLSPKMRDRLGEVHVARLDEARGLRAPTSDVTLQALSRRGCVCVALYDLDDALWTCTGKGVRLWMKFG